MRRLPPSTDSRGGAWCPGVRLLALLAAAAATPWPRDASQVVHDRYDIIFCHPPAGRSMNDRVAKLLSAGHVDGIDAIFPKFKLRNCRCVTDLVAI